jgi:DNA-binding response OmpR family regulator
MVVRVLVVEDDSLVASGIKQGLEKAGYSVDHVATAEQAEAALRHTVFDLAIVDLGLPVMDGMELIRRARRTGIMVPVLILTARDTTQDRVDGLDVGADDYLAKPFDLPELTARVRALIRRSKSAASSEIVFGPLQLNLGSRTAILSGEIVDLTNREWAILEMLVLNAPGVVSKDKMLESISDWDRELTPNAIEVYILRLRNKLAPKGLNIRTVRGFGYRLDEPRP